MAFDIERALPPAVASRSGAWDFIRGFAETWVTPLQEGDGYGERELSAAESRLGVRLPEALREAYALFGRRQDLTSNHDRLLAPDRIGIDRDEEALVFRWENQGAMSWGVLLADLARADPPVVVRPDLADQAAERWEPWFGSVSLTCVEMILWECLHAPEHLSDFCELEDGFLPFLREHHHALPFPRNPGATDEDHWFASPDLLIRVSEGCLWARARTEPALDTLRTALPGGWING
ncbi:SMI1/KNR4 family protein [Bailinhaonella thermotolerans]|uniref:SMI1/KNR4 family protein n=1 Tax=Bailinhaonella thermotolerans TaxID=1070861 RepID=A0A3A4BAQ7_9ACTN|nr:SMI1/KNR4 family protein [Bailinhaonella thermotolerans]RJL35673.1 SMI1/KNR4 family protein [Bailinhaonella thermotolerans]